MIIIIITCFIPGCVRHFRYIAVFNYHKILCVLLLYFTDEKIEAYSHIVNKLLSLGVLGFIEQAWGDNLTFNYITKE